jgi:hypothetical protein
MFAPQVNECSVCWPHVPMLVSTLELWAVKRGMTELLCGVDFMACSRKPHDPTSDQRLRALDSLPSRLVDNQLFPFNTSSLCNSPKSLLYRSFDSTPSITTAIMVKAGK